MGDPLDLLLDTICNLFGVVIFVAILAALLAGRPDLPESMELAETPSNETEVLEIDSVERINADRGIARGEAELDRRQERIEIRRQQLESLRSDASAATSLATLLQAENEALEMELRAETDAKNVQLRTPRQRELAEMLPAQIVISNRRAYVVNDWSRVSRANVIAERCIGWTTWNPDAVYENASTAIIHHCYRAGGQDIERLIRLRPDGGIPLVSIGDLQRSPQWNREIGWFDKDDFIISLKVSPDSFEEFALIRGDLAARGFQYDVEVIPRGPVYEDRLLEGMATAQ
ncbi:hypothetical protein OAL71_02270 [Phycisphaerales bacterium]|nr:hypothetical protein [Phycisphaerales bacterium]